MSQAIVHTAQVLRQVVIGQAQALPEEQLDKQPTGFNNTVRWNLGHIVYWMDTYMSMSLGTPSGIPAGYEALFNSGTKPSDWATTPPSKEELFGQLAAQLSRMAEIAPAQLEAELAEPFVYGPFRFETAGELMNFALVHEAIHLGTITSQLKVLSAQG